MAWGSSFDMSKNSSFPLRFVVQKDISHKKKNVYAAVLRMKLQLKRTFKPQSILLPARKMRHASDICRTVWWDKCL